MSSEPDVTPSSQHDNTTTKAVVDTEDGTTNTATPWPVSGTSTETWQPWSCIPSCCHRTKGGGDQIRCCLCGVWSHIKCLKLSPDETTGVWPCFDCRSIASDIKIMKASMLALTINIQHMIDAHSEELGHLRKKCESLEKDNASLKETNKRLEIKLTELKTAGPQLSSTNQTKTSLLSAAQWSGILMPLNYWIRRSSVSQEVTSKMYMIICISPTEPSNMLRYWLEAMTVWLGRIWNLWNCYTNTKTWLRKRTGWQRMRAVGWAGWAQAFPLVAKQWTNMQWVQSGHDRILGTGEESTGMTWVGEIAIVQQMNNPIPTHHHYQDVLNVMKPTTCLTLVATAKG